MDEISIGIAIAIFVVIYLLLDCRNKRPSNGRRSNNCASSVRMPSRSNSDRAPTGSAVETREANDRYSDLKDLQSYDDYNDVAQYMSLDPTIYDSHGRYSRDMGRSTSGASMMSVRDDPNDVVPWVARKPFYQDAYSKDANVRVEPSEYHDQMSQKTYYPIG